MSIEPFVIPYCEAAVQDLHQRLDRIRWPDTILGSAWEYGADLDYMREICAYWRNHFDWKAQVENFSAFQHYRYAAPEGGIHFIHERGKGPKPLPLLLLHGWPGSFLEMLKILPRLTDPAAHGGDATNSFDVVIPSLPGYGFSDRPTEPGINPSRIAEMFARLMSELGYQRYVAQGGDFGANISTVLALRHPDRAVALHLNYIPGSYKPYLEGGNALSEGERQFVEDDERWHQQSGAYSHLQATEPQTVAYALNDSPAGLAAWLIEKFRDWADCDGDLERRFTRDELLTHVTLYWITQTIHSSCRLYYESKRAPLHFGKAEYVGVPCGIARFAKEEPFPPRDWVQRGYNVQRWTEMAKGGHFAALEEPEMLVDDIRQFFRCVR
jgi:pimeloyl-ACP methyl ester carboxylesterase